MNYICAWKATQWDLALLRLPRYKCGAAPTCPELVEFIVNSKNSKNSLLLGVQETTQLGWDFSEVLGLHNIYLEVEDLG